MKRVVVRLLGAVEVAVAGEWVSAGRPKQRGVLAVLALSAGRVVTVRALVEAVWGSRAPETAVGVVYSCVSQLRRRGVAIERVSGGYRLGLEPGDVDVFVSRELAARAREAFDGGDLAEAGRLWERAAGLWRGTALAGVEGVWAEGVRGGLTAELQAILVGGAEVGLRCGRHRELVEPLSRQVGEHPLSEELCARLMLALHRSGREAEALARYERLRVRLRDELGHEPGEAAQELHRRILRRDPGLTLAEDAGEATVAPAQLPADTAVFTGRRSQLAELRDGVERSSVVVIDGPAGVGKTALAVRLGRELASQFPDGQLFGDLHGYTGTVAPVSAAMALERLLRGLGVGTSRIPADADERGALYRSVLASKRVLVVLDNAFDEDQVRPLLPGDGASRVVVTSRRRLSGLDEAAGVSLGSLTDAEAAELFGRVAARREGEAELGEIVAACGGLPLAVRIAAARLKSHPHWSHADLLRRLRTQDRLFGELAIGSRSVASAFAVSYAALPEEAQRLFRRLSLGFGPDISVHGAAALSGCDVDGVEPLLDELVAANLLAVDGDGRYRLHDLIRQYSHRTGVERDDADDRRAAQLRLLRMYSYLSRIAARCYAPSKPVFDDDPAPEGLTVPTFDNALDAVSWYRAERVNLLDAVRYAVDSGDDSPAVRLSLTLWPFAAWHGGPNEFADLAALGTTAADRLDDPSLRADMTNFMALWFLESARYDDAIEYFNRSIRLREGIDTAGRSSSAYNNIGLVHKRRGHHGLAIEHFRRAIAIAEADGKPAVAATANANCAAAHRILGQLEPARRHLDAAHALAERLDDERVRMIYLCDEAAMEAAEGHRESALRHRLEAAAYFRLHDDSYGLAAALSGAAVCLRELGRPAEALPHHREVLTLIDPRHRYPRAKALIELADTQRALGAGRGAAATYREDAVASYREGLELAESIDAREFQAQAHHGLAEVLVTGDPERAERHRVQAAELRRETGLPEPVPPKGF